MAIRNTESINVPFKAIIAVVAILFFIIMSFNLVEELPADKIMCIQNPATGNLTWYTTPGPKAQWFGKITKYNKRSMYKFSYQVRFNDAGHGTMKGSIQFDMPMDNEHLNRIQSKYGNEEAVKSQLLQTVVNKCLYMTGPMMSSRESYAEKRSYLINYVEDQIQNGVFKTRIKDTTAKDPITGNEKTVSVVEIVEKGGIPERQEEAVLKEFGVKAYNFSIENLSYDATVEAQIQQQQQMTMSVQTSIAEAKKAEQAAITAEANGKAEAAKAKWAQEAVKATAVTIAEKIRDSSKFMAEAAEFTKKEQTLLGEGEGARKRAAMMANGALEQKLQAWITAQQSWADAFSKYQGSVVPQIQSGAGAGGGNGATQFMEIMGMKAAKDLGLDMSMPKR
jgi:regulator of protease activity HflC (stomatin/prohibitin superfamily)